MPLETIPHVSALLPERTLSPTEIDTWLLCRRLWAFDRIDRIPRPQRATAKLGSGVHGQLERWLSAGLLPDPHTDEGQIAESGLHHWPAPEKIAHVERRITLATTASRYLGVQDVGFFDETTGLWVVGDHKTTKDFKYAKDAATLRRDTQAGIYALHTMLETGADRVELRWVYYRTTGRRKSLRVLDSDGRPLVVCRREIDSLFAEVIDPAATAIHRAYAEARTGLEHPPTATACGAFGGCQHRERCNLSPLEKLEALMSFGNLQAQLEAARAQQVAQGQINPPAVPPPPPGAPPALAPLMAPSAATATLPVSAPRVQAPLAPPQVQPVAQVAVVLPQAPLAPPPALAPAPLGPMASMMAASRAAGTAQAPLVVPATSGAPWAPPPAPAPAGPLAVPPPAAVAPVAATAQVAPLAPPVLAPPPPPPVTAAVPASPLAAAAQAPAPRERVYTLLVNASVAEGANAVSAASIVTAAHAALRGRERAENGQPAVDYRTLPYGQGPGVLCHYVREGLAVMVREGRLRPESVIELSTHNPAERDSLDAFLSFAQVVIRGSL